MQTTRRKFLGQAGALLAAPYFVPRHVLGGEKGPAPSDQIRIGQLGFGKQGKNNLNALAKQTVAVCDVDSTRLAGMVAHLREKTGQEVDAYPDYRRMLDDPNIDAIVLTVPDHWHAKITIDACEAGKDVYCEKPLTLTVAEGRAMVEAARKNGRIVQTGSQQRSDQRFRKACELARSGRLGKIHTVRAGLSGVNFDGPAVPDSDPPSELDYDFWLGPAPWRPYNVNRVHYNFRFFWDYSGGQLTNWGAHNLDIAQWGLGMDHSGPTRIEGRAKYDSTGLYEVPKWCEVIYRYPGDVRIICGMDQKGGTTFEGERGTIRVNRKEIVAEPAELLKEPLSDSDVRLSVSDDHHGNWLDCIRTRELPICDVEIGHRSATVCHLGNIAIRAGRAIEWDAERETIVGDDEARAMLSRPYRNGWQIGA